MGRLIFLLAVIAAVYWLLRTYLNPSSGPAKSESSEQMVRCEQCGVHLPQSESILAAGNYYCCDAHRLQHASRCEKS